MLGGASVGTKALMALWMIVLARALTASEFGELSLVLAMLAVSQIVADTGVSLFLTREVADKGLVESGPLVSAAMRLQTALGVLVGSVLWAVLETVQAAPTRIILPVVLGVILGGTTQVSRGVLRGQQLFLVDAALQVFGAGSLVIATLIMGAGVSVILAVWVFVACQVPVSLLLPLWFMWRWPRRKTSQVVRVRSLFRRTISFNLFGSLAALFTRLDIIILGWMASNVAVARYSASLQIFYGVSAVAGAAALALLPTFVSAVRMSDPRQARSAFVRQLKLYGLAGLACSVAVVGASGFMPTIFGPGYSDSVELLRLMGAGLFAVVPGYVSGQMLIAQGRQRVVLYCFVFAFCAGALIYPTAFTAAGVIGVAASMIALSALMSIIQGVAAWRVLT